MPNTSIYTVLSEVKKAVSGKDEVLLWMLTAILARGHILLEDIPGVGKTTIALALSRALGLRYGRMQFTPDVLPSDITGYTLYQKETGEMRYQPGAVLCNLFLADELNRATSRTQSALLEAMEEGQVTVDGVSHALPEPFIVIATQNPVGAAGTQLLPDSQIDRFTIRLSIGYPDAEAECEMVRARMGGDPVRSVRQVLSAEGLLQMQQEAASVYLEQDVIRYIVALTAATRESRELLRGASPRATLSVTAVARCLAWLQGRDYVLPRDALSAFSRVTEHRVLLSQEAEARGLTAGEILARLAGSVPAPKL